MDLEDEFFTAARMYDCQSACARDIRSALEAIDKGQAPVASKPWIGLLIQTADRLPAKLDLYDERVELAFKLRREETAGMPLENRIPTEAVYPDLVCTPTPNGLAISWRDTADVKRAFRDSDSGLESYTMMRLRH
jgi:hypothetical protein